MRLHCILCGCLWGSGEFTESSGVCPACFTKWVNEKKKSKGMRECYGMYDLYTDDTCFICILKSLCFKDTYGIE